VIGNKQVELHQANERLPSAAEGSVALFVRYAGAAPVHDSLRYVLTH